MGGVGCFRKEFEKQFQQFVGHIEPVEIINLIRVHQHQHTTQAHQLLHLLYIGLGNLVMQQLNHLQHEFLVLFAIVYTLLEKFEIQFDGLVVDSKRTHFRNYRLFVFRFLTFKLLIFLSFELLLVDLFEC